jgi:hypothetical protein
VTNQNAISVHWSFWVIAIGAVVWNGLGALNFIVQLDSQMLHAYRDSEQALIENRPFWATAGFATAVFGGVLGSVLLLLRKSVASYVFVLSLVGVIVTQTHTLSIGVGLSVGEVLGIVLLPLIVALFLVWYAIWALRRGWTG